MDQVGRAGTQGRLPPRDRQAGVKGPGEEAVSGPGLAVVHSPSTARDKSVCASSFFEGDPGESEPRRGKARTRAPGHHSGVGNRLGLGLTDKLREGSTGALCTSGLHQQFQPTADGNIFLKKLPRKLQKAKLESALHR